jgi:CPA2 family monovalent cation:H+ antiporter-2
MLRCMLLIATAPGCRERPAIVSILVLEDLAMALFLPLLSVVLTGRGGSSAVI